MDRATPTPNIALKVAIVESRRQQQDIARAARISETRFSHIVRGRKDATDGERRRIAKALNREIADLFPIAVVS